MNEQVVLKVDSNVGFVVVILDAWGNPTHLASGFDLGVVLGSASMNLGRPLYIPLKVTPQ